MEGLVVLHGTEQVLCLLFFDDLRNPHVMLNRQQALSEVLSKLAKAPFGHLVEHQNDNVSVKEIQHAASQ